MLRQMISMIDHCELDMEVELRDRAMILFVVWLLVGFLLWSIFQSR